MSEIIDQKKISLNYKGSNDININSFIKSLDAFSKTFDKIIHKIKSNDEVYEIKFIATKKGSFIAELIFNLKQQAPIIIPLLPYLSNALEITKGIFELRKIIHSNKVETIEQTSNITKIYNNEGEVFEIKNNVINIYNENPKFFEETLSKLSNSMGNDNERNGFEIIDNNTKEKIVDYSEKDVKNTSKIKNINPTENEVRHANQTLKIKQMNFESYKNWKFIWQQNNRTIEADVLDYDFFEAVKNDKISLYASKLYNAHILEKRSTDENFKESNEFIITNIEEQKSQNLNYEQTTLDI